MQSANRSLLRPVVEGMNDHTIKDEKYRITAIPVTTRRFGPSGSLKSKNNVLEHTRDVIPRISNDVFFELKRISVDYFTIKSTLYQSILLLDPPLGCTNRMNNGCGIGALLPAISTWIAGLSSWAYRRTTSQFPESDRDRKPPACAEGSSLCSRVQLTC